MLKYLLLTFLVGKTLLIGKIEVEGVKALSKSEVKSILRMRRGDKYYPPLFNSYKQNLLEELKESGYFDARIIEERVKEENDRVYIYLKISEGPRYILNSVQISWESEDTLFFRKTMNILYLTIPLPYSSALLTKKETEALDFLRNQGYLKAAIERIVTRDTIQKRCGLLWKIEKGPRYKIEKIEIYGNKTVRRAIIEREIKIKVGQYVSPSAILECIRRIYSTGLFKTVYHTYEYLGDSSVKVLFNVEERKNRYIRFQGGVYPFELANINVELGHRNLFDNNQNLSLRLENGFELFNGFAKLYGELLYSEPYFLSTPLKFNLKSFGGTSKVDSTSFAGLETYLSYYWTSKSRSIAGLQWRKFLKGQYSEGVTNKFLFSTVLDKRDDQLYPTRGYVVQLNLSRAGGVLGGDYHFNKYDMSISTYVKIWKPKGVLALRFTSGNLIPLFSSTIPTIEKFKIGGDGTLRGYRYSEFYAISIYLINLELRSTINSKYGLCLLTDIYPQIGGKVFFSAGLGFRYFLPIGNLRVDWAYNPHRFKEKGYLGNLYINLGEMF
uniref:POTRA domain-containing protein n=1 Tax=candidate division WOR-3 bacterium TaxID=2052148 RepID=A0A7V4E4T9_UNCW3